MKVYIVTYNWGSYGGGIEAVFSTLEAAERHVEEQRSAFGSYSIEEREVK